MENKFEVVGSSRYGSICGGMEGGGAGMRRAVVREPFACSR